MRNNFLGIIFILILMILYKSLFIVQEGYRGIVLRFGNVLSNVKNQSQVYLPGLYFKIPFVDTVQLLDARIQTLDAKSHDFITKEKKKLIINSYIKWKINDFNKYYLVSGGNIRKIEKILKHKLNDRLLSIIEQSTLKHIIKNLHGNLTYIVSNALNNRTINNIHDVNKSSLKEKKQHKSNNNIAYIQLNNEIEMLGIKIIDIRIKDIHLPSEESNRILDSMRIKCKLIIKKKHLEAKKLADKIRSTAYYKVLNIIAEAHYMAEIIYNNCKVQKIKLLSKIVNKDLKFYEYIHNLHVYEHAFDKNNSIILNINDFFLKNHFNIIKYKKK